MYFVPDLLFIAVLLPAYYFTIAWLSRSRYINHDYADFPWEMIPGMSKTHAPQSTGRVAVTSSLQIGTIALVMSGILLSTYLLLQIAQDFHQVFIVGLQWLVLTMFFSLVLNPTMSKGLAWLGTCTATALILVQSNWPGNWIIAGSMGLMVTTSLLMMYRNIPLRAIVVLSVGLILYDILNVYGTGLMEDAIDLMGKQARASAMISVPQSVKAGSLPAIEVGLGDILFSGLWIIFAARTASETKQRRVLFTTMLGITVGWVLCDIICHTTHRGVPALMTLLPCAAIGYLLGKPKTSTSEEGQAVA